MARLIKSNGKEEFVTPKEGGKFSLAELQGYVGGYIEGIRLNNGCWAFCDEEGKLKGKSFNITATAACKALGWLSDDILVGDIIICNGGEVD